MLPAVLRVREVELIIAKVTKDELYLSKAG